MVETTLSLLLWSPPTSPCWRYRELAVRQHTHTLVHIRHGQSEQMDTHTCCTPFQSVPPISRGTLILCADTEGTESDTQVMSGGLVSVCLGPAVCRHQADLRRPHSSAPCPSSPSSSSSRHCSLIHLPPFSSAHPGNSFRLTKTKTKNRNERN